ncbi:MAG: COX15/CtaA family protein [Solirubrobacteraceae bacterium]
MIARLADRLAVTPDQYRKLTYRALFVLSLIVFTGAAVRLTSSGLGCPTWPKCYGKVYPPLQIHALIEFGNRAISGLIGIGVLVTAVLSFTRRPFRRDLAILATMLPLGVVAQAVLGGFTVRENLAPGFVMAHFGLSDILLIPAFALAWRATYEPGSRPRSADRTVVWTVRALGPLAAITIFAGTAATAAGPHSGGVVGQHVKRLTFKGADTLEWVVHQHATLAVVLGVVTLGAWVLKRQRGFPLAAFDPLTVLALLLAAQGLVGSVQYELKLPGEIVWVHVVLATANWVCVLWAIAAEGRLLPRSARVPVSDAAPERTVGSLQGA